jgi:alpha-1,2-mannosyltransferase
VTSSAEGAVDSSGTLAAPGRALTTPLLVVSILAGVLAIVQLGRLSVFIADPARVGYSVVPWSEWELRHACVSAYFVAARDVRSVPNIYDESLYSLPGDPTAPRRPRRIGEFNLDVYEYPPPFLLLPRPLRLLAPDFLGFRRLWFLLSCVVVVTATIVVARAMGGDAGRRALLLAPLVFAAIGTLSTLQKGNVQLLIIALSMLAMVLVDRRQYAAGAALLTFATASKLYPGLLVLYLLARREWRALAWMAVFVVGLTLAGVVDLGLTPFLAFVDHLPRLLSGEAFAAFRRPFSMAVNYSVPGVVFKLKLWGVPGMGFGAAKLVGWMYTLVIVPVTVLVARHASTGPTRIIGWLAILILATLRSPFLPQTYAPFPSFWLLTLLAATYAPTPKAIALTIAAWLTLNIFVTPEVDLSPQTIALITTVPQLATLALAVIALRRREETADSRDIGSEPAVA